MKGTASLSSTLLARKGTATPVGHAATYQITDLVSRPRPPAAAAKPAAAKPAANGPSATGPVAQTNVSHPHFSCVHASLGEGTALSDEDRKKLVKVSLRLDPARHLRLRLSAAHMRQSAQQLLLSALDHYLDQVIRPEGNGGCAFLRAQAEKPAAAD